DPEGDALIVGWGGTRGAITSATEQLRAKGLAVSSIHIRHINPLPPDLTDIFSRFKKVFVAEINLGQLWTYLRATLLLDSISINQVRGKPFMIQEIMKKVEEQL
ncbi:MAG: 2-oxoglutarate ferredoxin oxidoreductase subunit alpha, partial [Candidatus Omnitrophica bacterium]|nr:2-oxoglutarate ferredoxin oxidoreductase subunit alpha [Candidatus Omnitrophota bacterium]